MYKRHVPKSAVPSKIPANPNKIKDTGASKLKAAITANKAPITLITLSRLPIFFFMFFLFKIMKCHAEVLVHLLPRFMFNR
jgi:hypothetical protein